MVTQDNSPGYRIKLGHASNQGRWTVVHDSERVVRPALQDEKMKQSETRMRKGNLVVLYFC